MNCNKIIKHNIFTKLKPSIRNTALETKQKLTKALFGHFRTIQIHVSEPYLFCESWIQLFELEF